jgi:putative redox protein
MADKSVRVEWRGDLGFEATTGHGGMARLAMDDHVAGTRPTESVLVALGACTGADVVSILRKKRQPMSAYHVEVRGDQRSEHQRSFERIDVLHQIDGEWVDAGAVRRSIELSVTRYCAVTAQLASGDVTISHRYRLGESEPVTVAETGPHGHLVVFAEQQAEEARG